MDTVESPTQLRSTSEWAKGALEANKRVHDALVARVAQLESEIQEGEQLLLQSKIDSGSEGEDSESEVWVPGGKRATAPCSPTVFLQPSSPFYQLAKERSNYVVNTTPRPMKPREVEALGRAVRLENERLQAYKMRDFGANPGSSLTVDIVHNVEGIDWQRVAERVSDGSSVKRTARECEIAWIGNYHPSVNHKEWTKSEIKTLCDLVRESEQEGKVDWVDIAKKLGTNRTPIDCLRHGLTRPRFKWTSDLDNRLREAVKKYGIHNWQQVAKSVSDSVTALQCQSRWIKSLDPTLRHGAWSAEEDERLRKAVAGYGTAWIQVATAVPGRTNDQCRERWLDHLSLQPEDLIWTEAEDEVLLKAVSELGKQWKAISLRVGNKKTGPNCRTRYEKLKQKETSNSGVIAAPSTSTGSTTGSTVSTSYSHFWTGSLTSAADPVAVSQLSSVNRTRAALQSTSATQEPAPLVPESDPRPETVAQSTGRSRPKPRPVAARRSTRLSRTQEGATGGSTG